MIFIVFLHILRIQVRCRENRTYGDFNACYDPRTPSCLSMQLTVYKHFSFKPPPTWKIRFVFLIVSSTVYHSPYCYTVLNGFWTSIHLYVRAFLPFFLTQVFTPFHICASLFFCFLLFLLFSSFFSVYFSFIPSFRALVSSPSTLFFCALHLTRLSPCLFQFSSQSSRKVRLLTTHIPPNSPRIVVIMLILTTLGWCPLNVISSKISAFLSADFQSTGSLTFKSHVPVFVFIPCHYLSRMYHNSR